MDFGVGVKTKTGVRKQFNISWSQIKEHDFSFNSGFYICSVSKEKKLFHFTCVLKIHESIFEQSSFEIKEGNWVIRKKENGLIHLNYVSQLEMGKNKGYHVKRKVKNQIIFEFNAIPYHKEISESDYLAAKKRLEKAQYKFLDVPVKVYYGGSCSSK